MFTSTTGFIRYIKLTTADGLGHEGRDVWINAHRIISIHETYYGSEVSLMDLTDGKPTTICVKQNPRTVVETICSDNKK